MQTQIPATLAGLVDPAYHRFGALTGICISRREFQRKRSVREFKELPSNREVLVLLSGGLDSTTCLKFFLDFGRPPRALFVDYGQPAASQESSSASLVASHYGVPLRKLFISGSPRKPAGLIVGRNAFLLTLAVMEAEDSVSTVAIGIHDGTEYPDCSSRFVQHISTLCAYSGRENIEIAAPFQTWTKRDVFCFAQNHHVPMQMTHSCERGAPPCGRCISCSDRKILYDCETIGTQASSSRQPD